MNTKNISFLLLFAISLMISCVSSQKYQKAVFDKKTLSAQITNNQRNIRNLNREIQELKADNNKCYSQYQELEKRHTVTATKQFNNSTTTAEQLGNKQEELLKLQTQIDQKRNELNRQKFQVRNQQNTQAGTAAQLAEILTEKEEIEQQLMYRLKQAFRELIPESAIVQRRKGRIYISFAEWLLFNEAQTNISEPGAQALRNFAKVMRRMNDLTILIEGHADNSEQGNTGSDESWNISWNRASMVSTALIDRYGIEPERITVAGRGLHYPVASNQTDEGRSKNRRVEVILEPNLSKLYDFLQINQTVIRKDKERK